MIHDLKKLEFTPPENASKQVKTYTHAKQFLKRRVLKNIIKISLIPIISL